MINDSETKKEDEISLLDLFTVLLRYRKLIIGITVFSFAVAIAGYFFYPVYQHGIAKEKSQIQGRILISSNPVIRGYVPSYLESFFTNAVLIADALKEAGMDSYEYSGNEAVSLTDESERLRALYLIDQHFVQKGTSTKDKAKKKLQVNSLTTNPVENISTTSRDNSTIEVIYTDEDPAFVESFLHALFSHGNTSVGNNIRPQAEVIVRDYEYFLNLPSMTESIRQFLEYRFDTYTFYKGFLKGDITPLMLIGEPLITEPEITLSDLRKSFRLKALIIVFAGFLFTVLLSFVFTAIRSIKNDPEAMKKINEAMGSSKAE